MASASTATQPAPPPPPPPGGDGNDPGKKKPPASKPGHTKGGNKNPDRGRKWEDDEKEFARKLIISNQDNGRFPVHQTYTWQHLTDAINAEFAQRLYTNSGNKQVSRGDRLLDGVRQQFRPWWRDNGAAYRNGRVNQVNTIK